jgi:hypothetical protein
VSVFPHSSLRCSMNAGRAEHRTRRAPSAVQPRRPPNSFHPVHDGHRIGRLSITAAFPTMRRRLRRPRGRTTPGNVGRFVGSCLYTSTRRAKPRHACASRGCHGAPTSFGLGVFFLILLHSFAKLARFALRRFEPSVVRCGPERAVHGLMAGTCIWHLELLKSIPRIWPVGAPSDRPFFPSN